MIRKKWKLFHSVLTDTGVSRVSHSFWTEAGARRRAAEVRAADPAARPRVRHSA